MEASIFEEPKEPNWHSENDKIAVLLAMKFRLLRMIPDTIDTGALTHRDWFSPGERIVQSFEVTKVIKYGKVFQLLEVDNLHGKKKIMKVLSSNAKEYKSSIKKEVLWFRNRRISDARRATFERVYTDRHFIYIAFKIPGFTLRDVLDQQLGLDALPRRHVREISLQILRALESLHGEGISHTDICPENIQVLSSETVRELVYYEEDFIEMTILKSSKIQLEFYGCVGLRGCERLGSDLYRSPEAAFGCEYGPEGDLFSFALVAVEMDIGKPMFFPCSEGANYHRQKALQFDEFFGPFGHAHMAYVNDLCGPVFDSAHGVIGDWETPMNLMMYLAEDHAVKHCVNDPKLSELVSGLLVLDPGKRAPIERALISEYFDDWY